MLRQWMGWCLLAAMVMALGSGTAHATNFAILLDPGKNDDDVELSNVDSITMGDLVVDERVMSTGADGDYRVYGPGDAHFGSITIRAWRPQGQQTLLQWWSQTSKGKDIRKNITVVVKKNDGGDARKYNFLDCFPTKWKAGERVPGSRLPVLDTLVVQPQGFAMEAGDEAEPSKPTGLAIGIAGDDGSLSIDEDFTSWGGGAPVFVDESGFRDTQFRTTSPGHKFVDSLTLRGPLTPGRKALCQWITEVVQGKPWKRTLTVKEITKDGSAGKTFLYEDCFPIRYVFPQLKAGSSSTQSETLTVKIGRIEFKT